ncbi:MAG TPA: hypothetical protein VLA61_19735 [Ideonella sp.]|uniref:hypothetical protein n=1 Tax=Ideonella sp. TaxID=1929293 RepID=UPI002CCA5BA8|nr:hypothetical protein [Ideonella sp.]HSI50504.1 hypothetical protein [Ideonella sp.]
MSSRHAHTLSLLLAALALQPLAAQADSACWPEAKLIGTSATGYVRAYKLWAQRPDAGDKPAPADAVPTWTRDGQPGKPLRCEDIGTFNGACRDEYAYVPLWGNPTVPRVETRSATGEPVWLQVDTLDGQSGTPVMAMGRRGELVNPEGAPLLTAHNPKAAPVKSTPASEKAVLAYMQKQDRKTPRAKLLAAVRGDDAVDGWSREVRVLAFAKLPDGLWMQLAESWARSGPEASKDDEPGPILRTGWLRHRDVQGKLLAVVQAPWCD